MKTKNLVIALFLIAGVYTTSPIRLIAQEKPLQWEVYFSPRGGCTAAITTQIDKAKESILVQAYELTSSPIASALLRAHKRGVAVEVVIDNKRKDTQSSQAHSLFKNDITVKVDSKHNAANNKVMIIDESTVITGSFNFTNSAETRNAENLLILFDKNLAARYIKNWLLHNEHSKTYHPKEKSPKGAS